MPRYLFLINSYSFKQYLLASSCKNGVKSIIHLIDFERDIQLIASGHLMAIGPNVLQLVAEVRGLPVEQYYNQP